MICKTCKKDLPHSSFYTYKKLSKFLLRSDCKQCYAENRVVEKEEPPKPKPKFDLSAARVPCPLHDAWRAVATCDDMRYIP